MEGGVRALSELFARGDVVVLSGAGLSTESGIPDYRGPTGMRRPATPMTYQTFTRDPGARRRYWARSHLGWRTIARAAPNAGHHAVGRLQRQGYVGGIITQNVDGLHQAGGADPVVELHGGLDRVVCLDCGDLTGRAELHARLTAANPGFDHTSDAIKPDGDVDLTDEQVAGFATVDCGGCGGMLKPDVVFFGESVPAPRVQECFQLVEKASALVVLGSSLTVMSGRRFVVRASKLGLPIAIVNQGATKSDALATLRLDTPLGAALNAVAWSLRG
ncbi:NAD-dependent protein deacetylase [Dactylosporangium sp. AC04546]|nr:NAD-dependent protein deacetylase [Dactylosporangium sp. AC04546]WVK85960.1 NAD-dependent protein deacetylase [Dactylosporangium sp. AC04546]